MKNGSALLILLLLFAIGGAGCSRSRSADSCPAPHYTSPVVDTTSLRTVIPTAALDTDCAFRADTIDDSLWKTMQGRSIPADCPVSRTMLRHLYVLHVTADGDTLTGELVCHRDIANDLLAIFRALFRAGYPIERMRPIDHYEADDERSMADDNTSAFNYRRVAGSQHLSAHASGMAIDINPLYNPLVRRRAGRELQVSPAMSRRYADRTAEFPYKIVRGDLCYRLFRRYGFTWGGDWRTLHDYQHFERR